MTLRWALFCCLIKSITSQDGVPVPPPFYTVLDDASWAVYKNTLKNDVLGYDRQNVYDVFMDGCRTMAGPDRASHVCDQDEMHRMEMNYKQPPAVYNFTDTGFKKIRAPKEVTDLLVNFWLANKDHRTIEWGKATPYHNTWDTEPTVIGIEDENLEGGGYALRSKVANYIRDEIEKWTGMKQAISSVYGIRSYHNGSMLAPHLDRLPLVSSAILNVAQDVDEDWPLEVYDHNGIAHNITMKPGDLVLYESHSIIHGRPFAMKGNFYANVFVHFEPLGAINATLAPGLMKHDVRIPPYLIPDTPWEEVWRESNPNGWNVLEDTHRLVVDGDLPTIQYAYQVHPTIWNGTDEWTPIHEAIRHSHFEIARFLIETADVDLSIRSADHGNRTPYEFAIARLGDDHFITQSLQLRRGDLEPRAHEYAETPPVQETVQSEHDYEEDGEHEYSGEEEEEYHGEEHDEHDHERYESENDVDEENTDNYEHDHDEGEHYNNVNGDEPYEDDEQYMDEEENRQQQHNAISDEL